MKPRYLFLLAFALLLSACNFSLAEDITPPPGYISPTPVPTLVLYPSKAPSVANGARIYVDKCAPCHGATGLGDGEKGIQLGVTVPAFGLAEIARPGSPAQYYTMVTRGNLERFMPPFNSLNDQQRWDVVAYVLTMHTAPDVLEKGKQLFQANCANCTTEYFKNQQGMSKLTEVELARLAKQGNGQIEAFGAKLSEDELWAVAAYMRSLSFDTSPLATPPPVAAASTPVAPQATPEGTSQASTAAEATVAPQPGFGIISGSIENKTGKDLPSDFIVTLHSFDHNLNGPGGSLTEIASLESKLNADGSYAFENVEMPANRIFRVDVNVEGIALQSEFAVAQDGSQLLTIPTLTLYRTTEDLSGLVIDSTQVIFEYGSDSIAVYNLYSFRNPTDAIIIVPQNETGDIPFIKFPKGSSGFGFEPTQDSEQFVSTENGFAIPPSEKAYGLVAFSSLPKSDKLNYSQAFASDIPSLTVFTPVGMAINDPALIDLGTQKIQNTAYQVYQSNGVAAGDTLAFTLAGKPQSSPATSNGSNTGLLIGAAALGITLLVAGLWMYRQDKQKSETGEDSEDEFESAEDVMDAIITLDDLHGKKKITEDAYQKRRAELKEMLKREVEE